MATKTTPATKAKIVTKAAAKPTPSAPAGISAPITGVSTPEMVALTAINNGWKLVIRTGDPMHITDLRESVRENGLLEPLIIDRDNLLIAGTPRLAAILELKEESPADFKRWFPGGRVAVNRLPFSATEHPLEAIAASVAENQKRQDLNSEVIKAYKQRLSQEPGIHAGPGRPKKGERALIPLLQAAFKRSPRLIRERTSPISGQKKPGGDRRISTTQPVSAKSSGVRPTLLVQAKQHLIGLNITEADYQALIVWCQLTRAQRQS